jgi:hypothetical protein
VSIPQTVFDDNTTPVVPYDDLRAQIKDGDILLCSGTGAFSTLIQKATNSIWSHVGFLMWLPTNPPRLMILESVESIGVRSVPLSSYMSNYNGSGAGYPGRMLVARRSDFGDRALTPNFINFAVDRFGWPYANEDIVEIAAAVASHGVIGNLKPDDGTKRTFICSEYVDACYRAVGIVVPWDRFGFIAPADFADDPTVVPVAILDSGWQGI